MLLNFGALFDPKIFLEIECGTGILPTCVA